MRRISKAWLAGSWLHKNVLELKPGMLMYEREACEQSEQKPHAPFLLDGHVWLYRAGLFRFSSCMRNVARKLEAGILTDVRNSMVSDRTTRVNNVC